MKYILFLVLSYSPDIPPSGIVFHTEYRNKMECVANGRQIVHNYSRQYDVNVTAYCIATYIL